MRQRIRLKSAKIAIITALLIFAVSQLAMRIAIEKIDGLRDPQYAVKAGYLHRQLKRNSNSSLWIFLGTSKTNNGLVPQSVLQEFGSNRDFLVYNFGLGAADLLRQYISLKRLLENGTKPDLLGIEIFAPILGEEIPKFGRIPELITLSREEELEILELYNDREDIRGIWNDSLLVPVFGCRRTLLGKSMFQWIRFKTGMQTLRDVDELGWQQIPSGMISEKTYTRRIKALEREYKHLWAQQSISPASKDILVKIIELCKQNDINFFLYQMPEGQLFRNMYPPEKKEGINIFLANIEKKYEIPFIDAQDWMDEADFFDGLHLTADAAKKFTRRFSKELNKLPPKRNSSK